jgi:integrase/recombinase XerC
VTPDDAADRYARFIWRTGLGDTTKAVYEQRVRSFLTWLAGAGEQYADALTDEHVRDYACRDYRRMLLTQAKRAPATVSQHMSALGSFYDYLELGKPRGVSVEVPDSEKLGLESDDLRRLLRACERRGPRDSAIGQLLFHAGVRVGEFAALDVDDVLLTDRTGRVDVRYGKGGKPRQVPLNAQARDALRTWLAERATMKGADTPPLFLSSRGTRLAVRSIQDLIHKAGLAAGVHVSPHVLRHTFVRGLLEQGVNIVTAQELAGHKNLNTTRIYAKPRWESKESAVEKLGVEL